MFSKIVHFSIRRKLFVALTTLLLLAGGIYSMLTLPIDAVPDITNNQVQIVTVSPTLAPQEVEQLITFPIEIAMSNVMNVEEIRSVSRFGLSLVTVVFKEDVPTLDARQLVNEQIQMVSGEIPPELGTPELMPITTGLGEIYQYVLKVAPGYEDRYGIDIEELNTVIRTAYAGETAGVVFENERRFDLVVRLDKNKVSDLNIDKLFVCTKDNIQLPVSEEASIELENGPLQINRDATKRRVVIGVNVRDADIQQVVNQIRESLDKNVKLKPGYYFEYGGQFENLQNAISTLTVVIPIALMLILLLLFFAFHSITYSLVVFSTVPLSLIGGIVALWLRGLPFSISAGVGFIALFGVAVLNGILMINHFNDIRKRSQYPLTTSRIIAEGDGLCVSNRLQPKLTDSSSTCIGLANLSKRYRLLFGRDITIEESEKNFKVTLPLI